MSPQNTCCHYFSLGLHTKNKPESHLKSGHCMFALNFRFGLLKPFKCSTNVPEKQLSLPTNICFSILASCRSSFFCCSLCSLNVSYLWPDRKEIKQRCHAAGSFPWYEVSYTHSFFFSDFPLLPCFSCLSSSSSGILSTWFLLRKRMCWVSFSMRRT